MSTSTTPTPIIIDTDPGIDDAAAIMLAAASPEVKILGITAVAGNTGLEHTAPNAAALADLCRLDCPVGFGASGPLWRRDTRPDGKVHGADGLGGYRLPKSDRELEPAIGLLRRLIENSPDPVTLVAIGPLTNVALLMIEFPDVARRLERIVLMGGGTGPVLGNSTPAAEFNIYYDPDAGAQVFGFGVPLTMVGLNVTHEALVGSSDLAPLYASGGPVAQLVKATQDYYGELNYSGKPGSDALAQHDSLAMARVIKPELLTTVHRFVDVENVGRLTSGMTVVDHRGRTGNEPNCDVAMEVDADGFVDLLVGRLTELDESLR